MALKHAQVPHGVIRRADLRRPLKADEHYDLCLSLEVAEHLEPRFAAQFVRSLVSLSDHVVFSAAYPQQGGLGHVNEQPKAYWVALFEAEGYCCSCEHVSRVRKAIDNEFPNHDDLYPYINLMIFLKNRNNA